MYLATEKTVIKMCNSYFYNRYSVSKYNDKINEMFVREICN